MTLPQGHSLIHYTVSPPPMDTFIIYIVDRQLHLPTSLQLRFHLVPKLSSETMTKLFRICYSKKRAKLTARFLLTGKIYAL